MIFFMPATLLPCLDLGTKASFLSLLHLKKMEPFCSAPLGTKFDSPAIFTNIHSQVLTPRTCPHSLWCAQICFVRRCTGVSFVGASGMTFSSFCHIISIYSLQQLFHQLCRKKSSYQIVENTLVELPFCWPALPELLVVVVQALPMLSELRQTMLIDILDSAE